MKKIFLIFAISICAIFSCAILIFSCGKKNEITVKLVYDDDDTAHFGENKVFMTSETYFAFDELQGKGWLHTPGNEMSTFTSVSKDGRFEYTFTVDYEEETLSPSIPDEFFSVYLPPLTSAPFLGRSEIFVSDGIALRAKDTTHFYILNLETQEERVIEAERIEEMVECCFYDNKIFGYWSREKDMGVFDCTTGEYSDIKTELTEYGFMPLVNSIVGMNSKGKICIQRLDSGEVINTNIRGMKTNYIGIVRDKYYLTEKYLYFAKKDTFYCIKNFFPRLYLGLTGLVELEVPHKWYRYSLESGEVEKIKTEDPFIYIRGVVEEDSWRLK